MKVVTLAPNTVSVAAPEVNACDLLEYAKAAIEKFGWRNTDANGPADWLQQGGNPNKDEAATLGLSIHDALGLAAVELSKVYGEEEVGKQTRSGSKDWAPSSTDAYGREVRQKELRRQATELLFPDETDPLTNRVDFKFNDEATSQQEIIDLIESALAREC